jgi:hypothetical protein
LLLSGAGIEVPDLTVKHGDVSDQYEAAS